MGLCVCVQCPLSWSLRLWFYSCSESPDSWPLRQVVGGQWVAPLLTRAVPALPASASPLGNHCQARGWGGAVRRGLTQEEEAEVIEGQKRPCLPLPSPPHPLPHYQKASSPTSSTGQGPGVARARQRAHKGPGSPVPGRGHTRARGHPCQAEGTQSPLLRKQAWGGFPLRLRRN